MKLVESLHSQENCFFFLHCDYRTVKTLPAYASHTSVERVEVKLVAGRVSISPAVTVMVTMRCERLLCLWIRVLSEALRLIPRCTSASTSLLLWTHLHV